MTDGVLADPNTVALFIQLLKEAVKVVGKPAYKKLEERAKEIWFDNAYKKKFGFTLTPKDAKIICETESGSAIKILQACIGRTHWSLNFIKVGLFIYNISNTGDRGRVDAIRGEIVKNKGSEVLRIVNIGSTGVIGGVADFLDSLKNRGYQKEALISEYNSILTNWTEITIFVNKLMTKEKVKERVLEKINKKIPLFFTFSYGYDASKPAMLAIAELRNEDQLEPRDYLPDVFRRNDDVGTMIFSWSFRLSSSATS